MINEEIRRLKSQPSIIRMVIERKLNFFRKMYFFLLPNEQYKADKASRLGAVDGRPTH